MNAAGRHQGPRNVSRVPTCFGRLPLLCVLETEAGYGTAIAQIVASLTSRKVLGAT